MDKTKQFKLIEGIWPEDDIRRAFVAGATWWQYHEYGSTIWNSDRRLAEKEAEKRYPGGYLKGQNKIYFCYKCDTEYDSQMDAVLCCREIK